MPVNPNWAITIDIYEGNGKFTPSKATERIDGVIAQACRGLYQDKRFVETHDTCQDVGIPFQAYNQYVAQLSGVRLDPIRQADLLLKRCEGLNVLALWFAYDSAGLNKGKLNASTARDALAGLRHLEQQRPDLLVGVYGNPTDIAQLYADVPDTKTFPLWLARYSINQTQWNNTPNIQPHMLLPHIDFLDGLPWMMWQFASEINWLGHDCGRNYGLESYSVDINVWLGDVASMHALLNVEPPKILTWLDLYQRIPFRPI